MQPLQSGVKHQDTLSHYLICPRLWSMIDYLWHGDVPPDPESRLCLTPDAQPQLVVIGHVIYHGLKQGNPLLLRRASTLADLRFLLTLGEDMGKPIALEMARRFGGN